MEKDLRDLVDIPASPSVRETHLDWSALSLSPGKAGVCVWGGGGVLFDLASAGQGVWGCCWDPGILEHIYSYLSFSLPTI